MPECPSRFTLSQWKVGDLPAVDAEKTKAHISNCPGCSSIIAELEQSSAYCVGRRESNLAAIRERLGKDAAYLARARSPLWRRPVFDPAFGAAAAVLIAIFWIVFSGPAQTPRSSSSGIGFKGTISLKATAYRDGHRFEVEPDSALRTGDELAFSITVGSPGYLTVFSVGSGGAVAPLSPKTNPAQDRAPQKIETAGFHELSDRLVLKRAEDLGIIAVVFSKEPFDRAKVHARFGALLGGDKAEAVIEGRIEVEPFACDFLDVPQME